LKTSGDAMSIFFVVFARWQHYEVAVCPIWQR